MDLRCSALARAADEPLAGTAPLAPRWACLERPGPWPRDIDAHPDPAVVAFAAGAAAAGYRPLLIRRPGRPDRHGEPSGGPAARPDRAGEPCGGPGAGPARLYLADTTPGIGVTTLLCVDDLAAVPLPGPGEPLPGTPVHDPLLLVCTNGRRDRCCALEGRALARALLEAGERDVWECTHLGGHRFAPTALVLPTGYLYGRLDVAAAVAARKAACAGEVEQARCRGRSTWSPEGQVAELAVRAATGLRDAATLTVRSAGDGTVTVRAGDGRTWTVHVRPGEMPDRPASCGADPTPVRPLVATLAG